MTTVPSLSPHPSVAGLPDLPRQGLQQLVALARRLLGCDHLAHDALQEALLALSQQVERPEKPIGWLARAVVHRSRHLRRSLRRRRHHEHRASVGCDLHADCDNPLHVAVAHELGDLLAAVRDSLPEEQRTALEMFEVEGQDYRSIAAALGVPIGTVRSRLARAREALRMALRPRGEADR